MIFDKFIGLVERHFPQWKRYAEAAKIFHFPARAHEVLPKYVDDIEYLKENFFLPFRTVAVEDTASVIILHDLTPNARGSGVERVFIECLPMTQPSGEFCDSKEFESIHQFFQTYAERHGACWMITMGRLEYFPETHSKTGIYGQLDYAVLAAMDKIHISNDSYQAWDRELLLKTALKNAAAAVEEIAYFNSPDRFILEESPMRIKHAGKAAKILRSDDRPRYTILKPNEIRQRLQLPPVKEGGTKKPHDRRAHPRTFRSDKFVKVKGKTIIIPATWVGPSEKVIGNKRYRILLDR